MESDFNESFFLMAHSDRKKRFDLIPPDASFKFENIKTVRFVTKSKNFYIFFCYLYEDKNEFNPTLAKGAAKRRPEPSEAEGRANTLRSLTKLSSNFSI